MKGKKIAVAVLAVVPLGFLVLLGWAMYELWQTQRRGW